MAKNTFSNQILYLLLTGAIQGQEILSLHRMLKAYEQGEVSAEEMQTVIDAHDPELFLNVPFDEDLSTL